MSNAGRNNRDILLILDIVGKDLDCGISFCNETFNNPKPQKKLMLLEVEEELAGVFKLT